MENRNTKQRTWLICLGLALAVLAAYGPLWHCGFVEYDDADAVTDNPALKMGLSRAGVIWAFTTLQTSIWHPVTWLSYLLDFQLYGLNPVGYHASSLLLHLANSILLFLLLQRMTKAQWASALTAALFALHPLHVESVAWISERKDVLSTFFWMLSVWLYVRYVEENKTGNKRQWRYYLGAIGLFVVGLMAKPMVVTLPFVLVLLDYWPLQRPRFFGVRALAEKIPFLIFAAASCVLTFLVARKGGAVASLGIVPFGSRLANVPVSYARYVAKTFWPMDLAVFYPLYHWQVWKVCGATIGLILVTVCVVLRRRTQPYLVVCWLWFLGMLVPVSGLVQDGSFSIADRFTYLPNVGLLIMAVWLGRDWYQSTGLRAPIYGGLAGLAACGVGTIFQVEYWHNSESLFRHATEATDGNGIMESNLGRILFESGRLEDALPHLRRGAAWFPNVRGVHYNLGNALLAEGKLAEAFDQFEIYVNEPPDDPRTQFYFGNVLLQHGQLVDAIEHLRKAAELDSTVPEYHYELANALAQSGQGREAIQEYDQALQIRPSYIQACNNLASLLATSTDVSLRDGARAVALASRADQLSGGDDPIILGTLASAHAAEGDFPKAIETMRRAIQAAGQRGNSQLTAALKAQLALYQSGSPTRQ